MEEDPQKRIERACWVVGALVEEAEELLDKARGFSPQERSELPKAPTLWKEKEITRYLERLKEALRKPMVFRSRKLLEEAGLSSEGISTDTLEETSEIRKVATLLRDMEDISEVSKLIKEEQALIRWLKEGTGVAVEKLAAIKEAKTGFKRVVDMRNLDETLRKEILKIALENPGAIHMAEELDSQIEHVRGYDIRIEYQDEGLEQFSTKCKAAGNSLSQLESTYGLPTSEVKEWTAGKSLEEAKSLLERKVTEASEEHSKLVREWNELAKTLGTLGEVVPPSPDGIPDLKQDIEELENKCRQNLGEPGQELLNFIRGKIDFPDKLSQNQLKEALERLRPFLAKTLGGAEWPE